MSMICCLYPIAASTANELLNDPEQMEVLLEQMEEDNSDVILSLEKSWHGLHYVLTGSAEDGEAPLNFILHGREVGEDLGYGPPRLFLPEEVQQIDNILTAWTDTDFLQRFDPVTMDGAELYPGIWNEPVDELQEEYLAYFKEMKDFIQQAAKQQGIVN